jgi:hypothetical protein
MLYAKYRYDYMWTAKKKSGHLHLEEESIKKLKCCKQALIMLTIYPDGIAIYRREEICIYRKEGGEGRP